MFSARSLIVTFTLLFFGLLSSACGMDDLIAQEPTAVPTRTRRPTATATATDTATFTAVPATATSTNTATFTPVPATATNTEPPPTNTFTPAPATNTPRPAPPTATRTSTPIRPTATPAGPACPPANPVNCVTFQWIDRGRPNKPNECTFPNGTHISGQLVTRDGQVVTGKLRTAAMLLSIKGFNTKPYAYPGDYKEFPTENDGRWNAEFPKLPNDFEWHIFISAPLSEEPISTEVFGVASGTEDGTEEGKCGKPGTKNRFVVNWVIP